MKCNKKNALYVLFVFQSICIFAFDFKDRSAPISPFLIEPKVFPEELVLPAGLPYTKTFVKVATQYAKLQNDALQEIKDSGSPLPQSFTALGLLHPSLPIDSKFFVGLEDKGGFVQQNLRAKKQSEDKSGLIQSKLESETEFDFLQQDRSNWCFCCRRKK